MFYSFSLLKDKRVSYFESPVLIPQFSLKLFSYKSVMFMDAFGLKSSRCKS